MQVSIIDTTPHYAATCSPYLGPIRCAPSRVSPYAPCECPPRDVGRGGGAAAAAGVRESANNAGGVGARCARRLSSQSHCLAVTRDRRVWPTESSWGSCLQSRVDTIATIAAAASNIALSAHAAVAQRARTAPQPRRGPGPLRGRRRDCAQQPTNACGGGRHRQRRRRRRRQNYANAPAPPSSISPPPSTPSPPAVLRSASSS